MARWRIAVGAGIVVALAIVAAFVVGSAVREEPEVAAEPVVAPASPSPTATVDPDPMPELHNTGDDFADIARSLLAVRYWAYRHPEHDILDQVYASDCECLEVDRSNLSQLVSSGRRFVMNDPDIVEIEVLDQGSDYVSLKIRDRASEKVLVDSKGEVVDRQDGWESRSYRLLLVLDESGRWLIRDVKSMPGGEGDVDA